jgi:hypothetical protein
MATRSKVLHHALNVGVVDTDKLHRVDLDRMRLAAETQTNLMPDAVGKGAFRAGLGYVATAAGECRLLPFIAGVEDSFVLELSDELMRIVATDGDGDDDALVTRGSVTCTVTSGDFSASTGWTLSSASGQTSQITGGQLDLSARAHGATASCKQQVSTSSADEEHALRIVVARGPVTFRLGSTEGGAEYLPEGQEITLRTGTYSLAFTPTGAFWVEFSSSYAGKRLVDSITVESSGVMTLPTPWTDALLSQVRTEQSLDVMFVACDGARPMRIERYGDKSWGIANYAPDDGPFLAAATADLELTPSVTEGNGTLTASKPFFTANHVGALFYIYHNGQAVNTYLAGDNQFTPAIEISGITETNFEEREYSYTISGTWSGTLKNERSFDVPVSGTDPLSGYHEMRREQSSGTIDITSNASYTNDDNEDNVIEYVRIGFQAGDYTSGEAAVAITYDGGGGFGICRVVGFTNDTTVDIEVLTPFKGTSATTDWLEGAWSGVRGYPHGVALHDGRLWWSGDDDFWSSVSDAYESIDTLQAITSGDSAAVARSIAVGGRNNSHWMMSLSSLMIGTDSRIANVRASSLDEVVTASNLGLKSSGRIGSADIDAAELADDRAVFVERAGNRLYEIVWSNEKARYVVNPFTKLTTSIYEPGITELGVQVLPDQRVWAVIADGTVAVTVIEPTQQVLAFIPIETATDAADAIESIAIVPGSKQDRVFVSVKRIVDGSTVRYIEKMARDDQAGAHNTIARCMDSYIVTAADGDGVISGLDHLEGRTVYAWADGAPVRDSSITTLGEDDSWSAVVSGGSVTLPAAVATGACIGLRYRARYKSARLSYGAEGYTPMQQKQKLEQVGILLENYVRDGFKYGTEFDNANKPLQNLPVNSRATGTTGTAVVVGEGEDEGLESVNGEWTFDQRLCIELNSPKPATILSMVMVVNSANG